MKNHVMPPAEFIAPSKFSHRIRCEMAMCIISIWRVIQIFDLVDNSHVRLAK
ncbi:MAG: hypothetical protein II978_01775 [Clostridia bacterium]|nr:hypothetical protein [Clostridia bacterium]